MANPTTNYGWPMPTSTDLVTDLPADFALFGQPVDTSLKALNPETTLGDISFRSSTSNTNTRLGIGTNGQVLAVASGVPAWTTTADVTPLTTKGDVFTFSTVDARIGVGANNTVLTADSAEATGLKWATPASGGMTLLSTTTLTGSSVTISSISGAYKALKIFIRNPQMATSGWGLFMRFNADTTSNYHYWGQIGTTLYGSPGWNATKISVSNDNGTNLQGLGLISIDIPDYANSTSWKMAISSALTVADNATTGLQYQTTQGSYYGTAAVTSLQFLSGSGSLTSGTVYIYGVN